MDRVENHLVRSRKINGVKVADFSVILEDCAIPTIGRIFCNEDIVSSSKRLLFH